MKGFFITGTDTGVGKTVVTLLLLRACRDRGMAAAPMKPVQTGCLRRGDELIAPDLEQGLAAIGLTPDSEERRWMCPYRFEPACSPHLAAEMDGRILSLASIVEGARQLSRRYDLLLVEGAGGVLVPLNPSETMADLMEALGLPIIVAARPGLGTLNHTLLTLNELRRRKLSLSGVVLVQTQAVAWGTIEENNRCTLERLGHVRVARLPYLPEFAGDVQPEVRVLSPCAREEGGKLLDLFLRPTT